MFSSVAMGYVIAACIAAAFSFLGLIVAKEQKISEFRQKWIDEVRDDIATLIAAAHAIRDATRWNDEFRAQQLKSTREDVITGNAALVRLRLRLDDDEGASASLLALLATADRLIDEDPSDSRHEFDAVERDIVAVTSHLLREEWRRVKRGEAVFRMAKWVAFLLLLALLASAALPYIGQARLIPALLN